MVWTWVGPRNHVFGPPWEGALLGLYFDMPHGPYSQFYSLGGSSDAAFLTVLQQLVNNVFAGKQNMHLHQSNRNCSVEVKVDCQKQKDYKAEVFYVVYWCVCVNRSTWRAVETQLFPTFIYPQYTDPCHIPF